MAEALAEASRSDEFMRPPGADSGVRVARG